jgi:RecB family exonuclease
VLLIDERRAGSVAGTTPAAFLSELIGRRVLGEGERRAIVRRLAATREDVALPEAVRSSPSFAQRVLEAFDADTVPAPFETLVAHLRTLLAFADAIDVRAALQIAPGASPVLPAGGIELDAALAAGDERFAWRRLATEAGVDFAIAELGPPLPPPLDLGLVAGVVDLLSYAASQSDADARRALIAPQSGVAPDEARTLIATAGERAPLLDVIARGGSADATRFAHELTQITAAYRMPDATAQGVVAAICSAFGFDDAPVAAALTRIAHDFDRARAFADAWEAADLIAEIQAELAAVTRRSASIAGAEPAPALADETPAPVAIRKLSFSASSLNAYAECKRKWWFRYACTAVEDRGSSASFYGIAFHAALEDFHGTYTRFDGDGVSADALGNALDYCVSSAFDRHRTRFDAPVEFELQKRRARRTAKKYVRWLIERARRAPFEVIGCETVTDIELDGHRFVGFIDRLDRDDASGTVTVVDYKTGSIATSAVEYLAEVRAFREFQLPFYYWARTVAGDIVTRLALIPLKDALLDVEPVELEVVTTSRTTRSRGATGEIAVAELEQARARMIALADELSSGVRTTFEVTTDPDACRYCAYAPACRERPLALEERFAR